MKPFNTQQVATIVNLSVILFVIDRARCQEQDQNGNYNYNSADYAYNQGPVNQQGNNYDYDFQNNGGGATNDDHVVECYSCSFQVRQGTSAGHDNCRDPFISDTINRQPCDDACAKIFHQISEREYSVTRICLPHCKDVRDAKGYTQCCHGHLCNGAGAKQLTMSHRWLILTTTAAFLFASSWVLR